MHVCETPNCDICGIEFQKGQSLIDGKTTREFSGLWATMCGDCHKRYGVGLGTGKGQLYSHGNPNKIGG